MSLLVQSLQEAFKFGGKRMRVCGTSEEPWFCGKDVCDILGYANHSEALKKHINDDDKLPLQTLLQKFNVSQILNGNDKRMIYINKKGLISLLSKSRLPNIDKFILFCNNTFNISYQIINCFQKEQETIGAIIATFQHLSYCRQYPIGPYRIDLYFPEHKIAVECDENNHRDRDIASEVDRQKYIEKQLNCRFIRYNPDIIHFSIFEVINTLIKAFYH